MNSYTTLYRKWTNRVRECLFIFPMYQRNDRGTNEPKDSLNRKGTNDTDIEANRRIKVKNLIERDP